MTRRPGAITTTHYICLQGSWRILLGIYRPWRSLQSSAKLRAFCANRKWQTLVPFVSRFVKMSLLYFQDKHASGLSSSAFGNHASLCGLLISWLSKRVQDSISLVKDPQIRICISLNRLASWLNLPRRYQSHELEVTFTSHLCCRPLFQVGNIFYKNGLILEDCLTFSLSTTTFMQILYFLNFLYASGLLSFSLSITTFRYFTSCHCARGSFNFTLSNITIS